MMTVNAFPILVYLFHRIPHLSHLYSTHHEPQLAARSVWWLSTATHWSIRWAGSWRFHGTTTNRIHGPTAAAATAATATANAINADWIRRSAAATTTSDGLQRLSSPDWSARRW